MLVRVIAHVRPCGIFVAGFLALPFVLAEAVEAAPTTIFPNPIFKVGMHPSQVMIGEFNGDASLDAAVVNRVSNDVSILLGTGDGRFRPEIRFPAGEAPASIAVGDLDADGIEDLVLANSGSDDVSILLGRGDGTFVVLGRI